MLLSWYMPSLMLEVPFVFFISALYILLFISQIMTLEMEKSSSQQNLDNVVELATEQNICAREKFDEVSTVQLPHLTLFCYL